MTISIPRVIFMAIPAAFLLSACDNIGKAEYRRTSIVKAEQPDGTTRSGVRMGDGSIVAVNFSKEAPGSEGVVCVRVSKSLFSGKVTAKTVAMAHCPLPKVRTFATTKMPKPATSAKKNQKDQEKILRQQQQQERL